MRKIHLQYGEGGLELATDAPNVTLVEPRFVPGLPDEAAAFREAVRRPIGARPLQELGAAKARVAIVISAITRARPVKPCRSMNCRAERSGG